MDRMFESVCLFVCLSVCPEHNSKTNDPRAFKLGRGMTLDIPEMTWLGLSRSQIRVG